MREYNHNHPTTIPGYDRSLETLARSVENLRYDALAEFLLYLTLAMYDRSRADSNSGRVRLSKMVEEVGNGLQTALRATDKAWELCRGYMEKK